MSIHYKFKNTINYEPIRFDGVWISVADLKSQIVQQKKLGNSELQLENEETRKIYTDDQQIPKNTNIIVSRLPSNSTKRTRLNANQPYPTRFSANTNSSGTTASGNINPTNNNNHNQHYHNGYNNHHNRHHHMNGFHNNNNRSHLSSISSASSSSTSSSALQNASNVGVDGGGREAMELVSSKAMTEEEKIKYIQSQSTRDFDPSRYARGGRGGAYGRGGGGAGGYRHVPGPSYVCRKCGIPGHLISDCKSSSMHKVKRSSGIPRDFLMKVDSKEKGALMTPSGEYAVPYIDREAYNNPKIEKAPFFEDGTPSDDNVTTSRI